MKKSGNTWTMTAEDRCRITLAQAGVKAPPRKRQLPAMPRLPFLVIGVCTGMLLCLW